MYHQANLGGAVKAQVREPYDGTVLGAIRALTLGVNLKLCLDAGDDNSYPGGTLWRDVSGNGYDFFRGTTVGAEASDPTFTGTPGGKSSSEYFSLDGGDVFQYDSANETWMENLHKNNALFTLCTWVYMPSSAATRGILGTRGSLTGHTGLSMHFNINDSLTLSAANAGAAALNYQSAIPAPGFVEDAWNFLAVSVDEAAGASGGIALFTDSSDTFDATYSSPASGSASYTMQIGSRGNADSPQVSGTRYAAVCAWEGRALTLAQLQALRDVTRRRFGV